MLEILINPQRRIFVNQDPGRTLSQQQAVDRDITRALFLND